jgi:hypothetical protein
VYRYEKFSFYSFRFYFSSDVFTTPWSKVCEVNIQYNRKLIKSADLIKIEKQIVDSISIDYQKVKYFEE